MGEEKKGLYPILTISRHNLVYSSSSLILGNDLDQGIDRLRKNERGRAGREKNY